MGGVGERAFGERLRRLRLAAGLTQEALAERAGISAKSVGELERDPSRSPRFDTVALLADALGLDPEERSRFLGTARPDSDRGFAQTSTHRAPVDLPRPLTPLIGRTGVVDAVAELARRATVPDGARLLVLTGAGGIGKTRVAIAAAEQSAAAFPDGAVFVDLSSLRDPDLVPAAIARRLAIDERDRVPFRTRLAAGLRAKRLLLVLDNCEHLLPARDDVVALLEACPGLVVLATSRAALRVRGEREYRVAPLELSDPADAAEHVVRSPAVALFLDRARAAGTTVDPTADAIVVAEICRRLEGLPLAIELAAAWTRLISPAALLDRLEHRLPLLIGGPHDLPARQRTMRDTIAWSYDLLGPAEQRLFRRLCVFNGGTTAEAAATVCADTGDGPALLTGLAALVDRSLLRAQEPGSDGRYERRLTMLETVREFGLERLAAHGEADELHYRHAAYCLRLAEEAAAGLGGPDAMAWRARLDREHANMHAALTWLLGRGEARGALRLGGALARYWAERGHLGEGRRRLREALALPPAETSDYPAARTGALLGAACLALEQGRLEEAAVLGGEAVPLARALADTRLLVAALNVQGTIACLQGTYEAAARWHDEALALATTAEDRAGAAEALAGLASLAGRTGDLRGSASRYRRSLAAYRETGDQRGMAAALANLCSLATSTGEYAAAEAFGREALLHASAVGDTGITAETLWMLGLAALSRGHDDRARTLCEESLALRRDRGDDRGAAKSLAALGLLALRRADPAGARMLLIDALSPLRDRDDRHGQALVLAILGHVALKEGLASEAAGCLAESAGLFRAVGNPLYVPWCLEGLVAVVAQRERWREAACIAGTRDALRATLGSAVPAADPPGYEGALARCREALGDDAFAHAYAAGRGVSPDVALGMGTGDPGAGAAQTRFDRAAHHDQ